MRWYIGLVGWEGGNCVINLIYNSSIREFTDLVDLPPVFQIKEIHIDKYIKTEGWSYADVVDCRSVMHIHWRYTRMTGHDYRAGVATMKSRSKHSARYWASIEWSCQSTIPSCPIPTWTSIAHLSLLPTYVHPTADHSMFQSWYVLYVYSDRFHIYLLSEILLLKKKNLLSERCDRFSCFTCIFSSLCRLLFM